MWPFNLLNSEPQAIERKGRWFRGARHYEMSDTDRLNSAQFSKDSSASINSVLNTDLSTLRSRMKYEARNNEYLKGMMETVVVHLAGKRGPTIQINAENKAAAQEIEKLWNNWAENCDVRGKSTLADFMGLWARTFCTYGEILIQKVNADKSDTRVRGVDLRLRNLDPERLTSPYIPKSGETEIVMGVEVNAVGRPLRYHLKAGSPGGMQFQLPRPETVDAENILHVFREDEPEQVRGIPWLITALATIANIRQLDKFVIEAAKSSATRAAYIQATHPDADFIEVDTTVERQPGMIDTLPPGYEYREESPAHPSTNFCEFRQEMQSGYGRGLNMPGMMARLDSSNHNYSSARFDAQQFHKTIQQLQGWIESKILNPLFYEIIREAYFTETISLQDVKPNWIWPKPEHVDPLKEAKALAELRKLGLPLAHIFASLGIDYDQVKEQLKKEGEDIAELGFEWLIPPTGRGAEDAAEDEGDDDDEEEESAKNVKPAEKTKAMTTGGVYAEPIH